MSRPRESPARRPTNFRRSQKPRFVAGSIGPTTKSLTLRGDVSFQQLRDSYYEQAKALVEGGVDFLLFETGFDTRNVKSGLVAIQQLERELGHRIPIMVSGTIERWGAMLAGQPVDAFYASVAHADLLSIGLNCATGPGPDDGSHPHAGEDGVDAHLVLSERRFAERRRSVSGDARIARAPALEVRRARLAEHRRRLLRHDAGSHPRHGRDGRRPPPHVVNPPSHRAYYSGIELVEAEDSNRPLIVGERTNVIGSRLFKKMIAEEKWEEASEIARWQVKNGAHIIDVCLQILGPRRDARISIPSTRS